MIADQSNGYACGRLPSVENVWAYWKSFLVQKGMSPRRQDQQVVAYVNQSRWVADCPKCNGGMLCWSENPETCCLDCARVFSVKFPPGAAKAAGLLLVRPEDARNWHGESLEALARENEVFLTH